MIDYPVPRKESANGKTKESCPDFKAKVALAAMSGNKMVAELSTEYGVHQTQINRWVKQLKDNASGVFSNGSQPTERRLEKDIKQNHLLVQHVVFSRLQVLHEKHETFPKTRDNHSGLYYYDRVLLKI